MKLMFLGTSGCFPDARGDSPCMLVNDSLLIDCGWHPLDDLNAAGVAPESVRTVLFTHLHHDHYMGLPQLLFRFMMKQVPLSRLTVIGPEEDVERFVRKSMDLLEPERFFPGCGSPVVIPLKPSDRTEADGLTVESVSSRHPVAGRLYRIADADGRVLCLTGDTGYFPEQAAFFRGGHCIVSETACGLSEGSASWGHSSVHDAVKVADEAGIPRMFCIHQTESALRETAAAAQKLRRPPFTAEFPESFVPYEV